MQAISDRAAAGGPVPGTGFFALTAIRSITVTPVAMPTTQLKIFRVPVLGTGAPPVKVNPEEGPSSKSHDGKRLAFLRHSRANQTDTLVVANADGSNEQMIAARKWPERFIWDWATAPAWTNDDQSLNLPQINSDANGFFFTIYEIRLADRAEKSINLSPQRFEQPNQVSLLSDTSAVLFSARAQGASFEQLWYLGRDGSARSLTNDLSDYRNVYLTANSKSLVTTQTQTLTNIWLVPGATVRRRLKSPRVWEGISI